MKKMLIPVALILSLSSTGCATLFASKTKPLMISSDPRGADVYINGFKSGKTPLDIRLKPDTNYSIEFKKDGYDNLTRVVNKQTNAGWVIWDVLSLSVVCVIVDAVTNNWNKLQSNTLHVSLEKKKR